MISRKLIKSLQKLTFDTLAMCEKKMSILSGYFIFYQEKRRKPAGTRCRVIIFSNSAMMLGRHGRNLSKVCAGGEPHPSRQNPYLQARSQTEEHSRDKL